MEKQDNDKPQFYRKASDNNGTIRVNIPGKIAEHLNLQEGDTIAFQTEYTEKYGEYASLWNQTKQGGD